jgi:heme oxygenase
MDLLQQVLTSPPAPDRWPPLLVALRRAARPDRVRVAAYVSLSRRPASWDAYNGFLAAHGAWLSWLDQALVEAGAATHGPLPDAVPGRAAEGAAGIPRPRTRAQALGYLYVLEAFRLGCSVLARRIRGLAGGAEGPISQEQTTAVRPWGELRHALESVPPEEHPAVIESARQAFSAWEQRLSRPLEALGIASH